MPIKITFFDKATPRQFQHQGFVDRWNGTKLETIQCFNDGEPGPGQSQFLSMLIPLNWDFPYQLAIGRFSTLLALGYDGTSMSNWLNQDVNGCERKVQVTFHRCSTANRRTMKKTMGRLTVDEVYNTVLSIRNNSRRSFQDYGLAIEVSEVFRPTRLAERLVANRADEELRSDTPFHFFAGCLILSPPQSLLLRQHRSYNLLILRSSSSRARTIIGFIS